MPEILAADALGCDPELALAHLRAADPVLGRLIETVGPPQIELLSTHSIFGSEALPEATWAIKRGASGCAILQGGARREFPAMPAMVVDTTGAGDAFAAGYLVGGVELALETAARAVAKLGATP